MATIDVLWAAVHRVLSLIEVKKVASCKACDLILSGFILRFGSSAAVPPSQDKIPSADNSIYLP